MVTPAAIVKFAEDNITALLANAFADTVAFGPIYVEPSVDPYGDDNIDIVVFYDGDYALMDPNTLNEIGVELWMRLKAIGFTNIPTESYIDLDEHDLWVELNNTPPWLVE